MKRGGQLKRTARLDVGPKVRERGSAFKADPKPLKRAEGLKRETSEVRRRPDRRRRSSLKQGTGFSASPAQRVKVEGAVSIISGQGPCDPMHLWPRGMGGCDHPDCVVPGTRLEHDAFDNGDLDILPALIANGCWRELAHMVEAHHVDPLSMLHRLTGERHASVSALAGGDGS